jgi:hypothetical protein
VATMYNVTQSCRSQKISKNVAANHDDWDISGEGYGQDNICVSSLLFSYLTNHLSG